jgi:transcriptional regulator with XRE-family HTH domain
MAEDMGKVMDRVGDNLRDLRKERGFTQRSLGAATGIAYRTIAGIESDALNVKLSILVRLANAMDVSVLDLLRYRKKNE